MRDGQVAQWFKWYTDGALIAYHVSAIISEDRARYVNLLEMKFGTFKHFVIKNAFANDQETLLALVSSLCGKDGNIAAAGVEKANRTLRELGSPTVICAAEANLAEIARKWKLDSTKISRRALIEASKEDDGHRTYLYICQDLPTPHFEKYSEEL